MTKTTLVFIGTNISPKVGDILTDFRGDTEIFCSSNPPYEPEDSLNRGAKVYTRKAGKTSQNHSYPSVYGLEFVLTPEA